MSDIPVQLIIRLPDAPEAQVAGVFSVGIGADL